MDQDVDLSTVSFEEVNNYYEVLVRQEMSHRDLEEKHDSSTLMDIFCTVLNRLPGKYIRSGVDLSYYLTDEELVEMTSAVNEAMDYALEQVAKRGQ
jgi:hypothetical protein